jgi:hypothetical protein
MNIVKNKLHSLSAMVSLSYYLLHSYTFSQNLNSSVKIVEVIILFIKALHNEKWVKFEIFNEESKQFSPSFHQNNPQTEAPANGGQFANPMDLEFIDMIPQEESKLQQSDIRMKLHPNLGIMEKLWRMFDEVEQIENGLSGVVMLELVTNLRAT